MLVMRFRRGEATKALAHSMVSGLALACVPLAAGLAMGKAIPDGARGWLALASLGILLTHGVSAAADLVGKRLAANLMGSAMADLQRGVIGHTLRLPLLSIQARAIGERILVLGAEDSARNLIAIAVRVATRMGALAVVANEVVQP